MIIDVEIPNQGLTITEATLLNWVKSVGDAVAVDDVLFEFETDKAVVGVESPAAGWLLARLAEEGEVVPLGQVVAKLGTEASDSYELVQTAPAPDAPLAARAPEAEAPDVTGAPEAAVMPHLSAARPVSPVKPRIETEPAHDAGRVGLVATEPRVSPRARRAAASAGVDLADVTPSGSSGKTIRERDVLLAAEQRTQAAAASNGGGQPPLPSAGLAAPMSRLRRVTAQRTAQSFRDVPHFYLSQEINADRLVALRSKLVEALAGRSVARITVTDFLVRALALALCDFPEVNSQWHGDGITRLGSVDIGLAVSSPDGLLVPVLRDVTGCSLAALAGLRAAAVERARTGRSQPAELQGGSITLTNLGQSGVDQFDPIINAPQSGILAVGSIKPRPYVVNGEVRAVKTMILTLAMDHRVVDGDEGARFLGTVAGLLETPEVICVL